ncbi:hypothetical protein KY385_00600 [Candidatus Parcubacteria bacterium]|nr:hypothetical protein [Candidatus Parcubacteria bacterium]
MKREVKRISRSKRDSQSEYTVDDSVSLQSSEIEASQSIIDGLNDFSDALTARDDSFHCDRRTIWGDKISIRLVRKTTAGRT